MSPSPRLHTVPLVGRKGEGVRCVMRGVHICHAGVECARLGKSGVLEE